MRVVGQSLFRNYLVMFCLVYSFEAMYGSGLYIRGNLGSKMGLIKNRAMDELE